MRTVFSTYDIRGRLDESLTVEYAWTVGKAFAEWLPDEGSIVIVSAPGANPSIVHALTEGVLLQGRDVIDLGTADQQALVETVAEKSAAGGMIVGREDVEQMEVITLYDAKGVAITDEMGLTAIEELINAGNFLPAASKGTVTRPE